MQVNVQQISPVLVEFAVEIPTNDVRRAVDNAYRDLGRTARVKGYRQGKVPLEVLKHVYGNQVTLNVQQKLIDDSLPKALSQKGVQPLATLAISPSKFQPTAAFSYKARFEISPAIDQVIYEGFQVRKPDLKPADEDVAKQLEELRVKHSTLRAPEPARPAQLGDQVILDFELEVDGKVLPEGKGSDIEGELGKGTLLKELEAALVGASVAEKKDVSITFSEQHPMESLRGKEGVFHVTVKEVKERVLPALDDDFAKDVGEFETLDALRADIQGKIAKQLEQQAEDAVAEQLVLELCRANPIPVPPSLVQRQAEITAQELQQQARTTGQRFRLDNDTRQALQVDAEMKVRAGLLMAAIARAQGVTVNDADIEKAYVELSEQTGKNVARLKAEYRDQKKREILIGMILEDKILDILESKAVVTVGDAAPAAEAPAAEAASEG
ncbi:MAG: trigger factor [Polyangiaceae bacterium]|jgi:trigger factor|nr:trigger factor [Polyangiaceae bacterium]